MTFEVGREYADNGYLHAQWRRSNPLELMKTHTLVDGIVGPGQYVGTYIAGGVNSSGWWGEGEIKSILDEDEEYPTICGTGTEDYFSGHGISISRGWATPSTRRLAWECHKFIRPDGPCVSQREFGMYRWHILDPIHLSRRLRVDIQPLGSQKGWRYLPLQNDIASTSLFYLDQPIAHRPPTPTSDELEVHPGSGQIPDLR